MLWFRLMNDTGQKALMLSKQLTSMAGGNIYSLHIHSGCVNAPERSANVAFTKTLPVTAVSKDVGKDHGYSFSRLMFASPP